MMVEQGKQRTKGHKMNTTYILKDMSNNTVIATFPAKHHAETCRANLRRDRFKALRGQGKSSDYINNNPDAWEIFYDGPQR